MTVSQPKQTTFEPLEGEKSLPKHIAIIMDGNGRWAAQHRLPRLEGHRKGVKALRRTIEAAIELGIEHLTVFAFSQENWQRPEEEITGLMMLIRQALKKELAELHSNGIRLQVFGELEQLPKDIQQLIESSHTLTQDNTRLHLNVAISYGGRQDIIKMVQRIARRVAEGSLPLDEVNEVLVKRYLATASIPDPDLLIRTSGEQRISNFMLWEMSYTELFFTQRLWPDFQKADLEEAIAAFTSRERRYGKVS